MFDISTYIVPILLSTIITVLTMVIVAKKVIYPSMLALFEEKYAIAEGAISKGFSALGTKSAQMKSERKFEGTAVEEILDAYPEIMAVAEQVSPHLAEMIEDDPLNALRMAERYLPTLRKVFPDFFAQFGKGQQELDEYQFP